MNDGERLYIMITVEWANDNKSGIRITARARGHGAWNLDQTDGSVIVNVPT